MSDSEYPEKQGKGLDGGTEVMDRRHRLREKGYTFERFSQRVEQLFGLDVKEIVIPRKQPLRVAV